MKAGMIQWSGLVLLSTLTACTEDSADVETVDIRFEIEATLGDRIKTILYKKDLTTRIELSAGDRLVAKTDLVEEIPLPLSSAATLYEAELAEESKTLTIALERETKEGVDLPIALPAAPALTSPSSFSRADEEVTFTWSNRVAESFVTVFIRSCADIQVEFGGSQVPILDSGEFSVPMSDVLAEAGSSADCAQVSIVRSNENRSLGAAVHYNSIAITSREGGRAAANGGVRLLKLRVEWPTGSQESFEAVAV